MKVLTMLVVLFAVAVPSKGVILVYNVSESGQGGFLDAIGDPNDPLTGIWYYEKLRSKSFLVLDVNFSGSLPAITTAKQITYWRADSESDYRISDKTSSLTLIHYIQSGQDSTWILRYKIAGDILGIFDGTVKSKDIGRGSLEKRSIASGLKGWQIEESTGGGKASGMVFRSSIKMSLNAAWTKKANTSDTTKGFDQNFSDFLNASSSSPQGLVNWLESKGYQEIPPL